VVARRERRVSLELTSAPPVRKAPNKSSIRQLNPKRATSTPVDTEPPVSFLPSLVRAIAALGVSTLAVGGTAYLGIVAVQKAWGVNNVCHPPGRQIYVDIAAQIPEFSRRMRSELSTRFPGFTKTIESNLAGNIHDDELDDPSLDEWDYDSSKERLMKAFDEGGLNRLSEVAWEEMQTESRVLLRKRRREQSDSST
jgi:hypothetical protein